MLLAFSSLLAWGRTSKPCKGTSAPSKVKIVIDPGHGGEDTGAIGGMKGTRLLEKNVALAIAKALALQLKAMGDEVKLTRSDDTFIPLWDRARMANKAGADLFISLHLNAARTRSAKGSEVYFLSLDAGDADAVALAAQENAEAKGSPHTPENVVASILDDLAQKAYLQDSERLAVSIQNQLNRLGGIRQRGVKQAPFVVLRGAGMPAVLIETAFISNPRESTKLKDPVFIKKVAESIARGIRGFLAAGTIMPHRKALEGTERSGKALK